MLLFTSVYFVFLGFILALYWSASRWRTLALGVVLFANYFFYAKWDLFYLFLIPAASTADYLIGLGLARYPNPGLRRALIAVSVTMNLGVLASFKYMPFFLENWAGITGSPPPQWHWTFPLGISFYVFQSLTYTIDLYRRDAPPVTSYLTHLASVSFFPTTLSGPITRVAQLAPQLDPSPEAQPRRLSPEAGGRALFLIGLGLIKKLLIADYLGDNLVNRIFDLPKLYTGSEVLIGVYAYALQLFYDFSGYTDIAIGSALLLGVKLPENFNQPYLAINIADFWRRWHITLSNWLRDYLFFSLPGLRSRWKAFTYANLVLTMTLGGLWHGASWNFVLWGLMHGVALVVCRAWLQRRWTMPVWLGRVLTFHFVCFAWIFFRAPDLASAGAMVERIGSLTFSLANISEPLAVVLAIAVAGHCIPRNWSAWCEALYVRAPFYAQATALALLVVGLQYIANTGAAPFIYTRF